MNEKPSTVITAEHDIAALLVRSLIALADTVPVQFTTALPNCSLFPLAVIVALPVTAALNGSILKPKAVTVAVAFTLAEASCVCPPASELNGACEKLAIPNIGYPIRIRC
jgi:hypothetical protein